MEEQQLSVTEGSETFERWINQPYVPEEIKPEIRLAGILLVPEIGFRDTEEPYFPVGTESFFSFLRERLPQDARVDICIDDAQYRELALHHNLKKLGAAVVTMVLLPLFLDLVKDYVKERFLKDEKSKPPVEVITIDQSKHEMINNTETPRPEHANTVHYPRKHMAPPKVKFTVIVVDSASGKSKTFDYEGPASEVAKVVEQMKKLATDENR